MATLAQKDDNSNNDVLSVQAQDENRILQEEAMLHCSTCTPNHSSKEERANTKQTTNNHQMNFFQKIISAPSNYHHRVSNSGGDYARRFDEATRAAIASFLHFSILVLTKQKQLPSVWVGNIVLLSILKPNFGSTFPTAKSTIIFMFPIMGISWGVVLFLKTLDTVVYAAVLPPITILCTFLIMSCPWLPSKTIMTVIMWVILSSYIHSDPGMLYPLGLVGTCTVGCLISIIVNMIPLPRPAMAMKEVHGLLHRVNGDVKRLIKDLEAYRSNAGVNSVRARKAISSIEMYVDRNNETSNELKELSNAAEVEMKLCCRSQDAILLRSWVNHLVEQEIHIEMMKTSLKRRILGEEHIMYSKHIQEAMKQIAKNSDDAYDKLTAEIITGMTFCLNRVLFRKNEGNTAKDISQRIRSELADSRRAFCKGFHDAEKSLCISQSTGVPTFAYLIRRMVTVQSLFSLSEGLATYLEKGQNLEGSQPSETIFQRIKASLSQPWLWSSPEERRHPLKTAVGMGLASLWISVPALWDIAAPFGVWAGITVAGVSQSATGSSIKTSIDRLWATLMASAFGLLIVDFFPGNKDYIKIPMLTLFTFVAIYLRDPSRPHYGTYAAVSIGCIFYGSIKNDYNVEEYVTKRIELICVGVVTVVFVDLLLFPKSSKKIVEHNALGFFRAASEFLRQAIESVRSIEIESRLKSETDDLESGEQSSMKEGETSDSGAESRAITNANILSARHEETKQLISETNRELQDGIDEPTLGLCLPLHPSSFRGLVKEQFECGNQIYLIMDSIKELQDNYSDELYRSHPMRKLNISESFANFLEDAYQQIMVCCSHLEIVFPNGQIRPQNNNCNTAINAAATFRSFEEVRLKIIAAWSEKYQSFVHLRHEFGDKSFVYGVDLPHSEPMMIFGKMTSSVLELCRHLQKAGMHLENVCHQFPPCLTEKNL